MSILKKIYAIIAVACKDFKNKTEMKLSEFSEVKNRISADSDVVKAEAKELNFILETIDKQLLMNKNIILNYFWDMFILNAFLGNFDRHRQLRFTSRYQK